MAANALAETQHPHILRGFSPFDGLPNFYGLGMNLSYDQQGRLRASTVLVEHLNVRGEGTFTRSPAENK